MIETIYVGMSGLAGFSRGLRVIANNTTNLNTPGFKSATLQFADAFYANEGIAGQRGTNWGHGLNTGDATLSFRQGELRRTDNSLDLAIDGQGLFMLKGQDGRTTYTRAGQFRFDGSGVLVSAATGDKVMGMGAGGALGEISLAGRQTHGGAPTTTVLLTGNLASTAFEQTVGGLRVIDAAGGEHLLSVKLTNTDTETPGSWSVELLDGDTVVGTGQLVFEGGRPTAATGRMAVTYTPAGQPGQPLTLDFGSEVTSYASNGLSSLAFGSQDGFGASALTRASFDAAGVLVLTYASGHTVRGSRLALGRFDSVDAVGAVGDNAFEVLDARAWHTGTAGDVFGSVRAGYVEISNVDLSQEFSDLVIMQRGYQASSQVVSTANEMLQELFSIKGR